MRLIQLTFEKAKVSLGKTAIVMFGSNPKLFSMLTYLSKVFSTSFSLYSFLKTSTRWNKNFLLGFVDSHLIHYPTPVNITYAWSFGSTAGICLVIQIISGIFLAMHYTPNIDMAFSSVEYIMRDVPNGWLVRYIHANGASMFFITIYGHIFRGLYYGSYMQPRQLIWCSGVLLFVLMMATAFIGYVLPWGQMSFWGATVITKMFTAIPGIGEPLVTWLWGGYVINNATLNRFFSLHFVLPFVIAGVTLIHLALLHKDGSNNPLGVDSGAAKISFYPYFFFKDLVAFFFFMCIFVFFVFYSPNTLGHPVNYIPADSMHTPSHIVPEWYFLPFYAMLRSVPDKAGGILTMGGAILILFTVPFFNTSEIRNTTFRPLFKISYWLLVADFLVLIWSGEQSLNEKCVMHLMFVSQSATVYYFFFFLVLVPLLGSIESTLIHYDSRLYQNKNI